MNRNITSKVVFFYSILLLFFLASCSKKNTLQEHEKITTEQISNQSVLLIDPSICKDNSEGYIYFQLGEEVFRHTKDSLIQVDPISLSKDVNPNRKAKATTIPEGCDGNPYVNIYLNFNFKKGDDFVKNF
ncbi:MAG: hypothetical protein V4732_18820 [Pseudomonadota bacterium]